MNVPNDTEVEANGNLYVPDEANNRVLIFLNPSDTSAPCPDHTKPGCAGDVVADMVLGQGASGNDFGSSAPGVGPTAMNAPVSVRVDANGKLFVSDDLNNRVLMFLAPLDTGAPCPTPGQPGCAGDAIADAVFG